MDEGVFPKTLQEIILETIPIDNVVKFALSDNRLATKEYRYTPDANFRASVYLCHLASRCRNNETVTALLSVVAVLNTQNANGNTVLHFASLAGNRHIVEILLRDGADVNAQTKERQTALHFASDSGNNETAEALIKGGIDINVQNIDGDSALHFASELGCVKSLIAADISFNLQNNYGITALHNACQSINAEIVKVLIDAGADVNIKSCDGRTALHFALPDLSELQTHPLYSFRVPYYIRHANVAEYLQELNKIVKLLIDANIDVNQQCNTGETALHIAVSLSDNVDLIEELIFAGADVNKVNDSGETALHFAHNSNDGKVVQRLIKAGIDVNRQGLNGDTALHSASKFAANETVRALVFAGADVNRRGYQGYTPLHYGMRGKCNVEVLEILLTSCASVDIKDTNGLDPVQNIEWCTGYDYTPINVLKLHEHFKSYRDVYGNTMFHLMINDCDMNKKDELWTFIRARQAHFVRYLSVQNMFGQTPLHLAATIKDCKEERLDLIFSNFGECSLELLIKDEFGNTFLHTYLSYTRSHEKILCNASFIKRLLEGEYKNCPMEMIEKLVNSENEARNTPLHIFVGKVTKRNEVSELKLLLDMFLKAGFNINSKNSLGETVLHFLSMDTAKIAVENVADVNIQNISGESPIFIAPFYSKRFLSNTNFLEFLVNSGADMNKCNKLGQTALMMHVKSLTTDSIGSTIQLVLKKGYIKKQDKYGSNILHYIAWSKDLERFTNNERLYVFNWADFSVVQDHLGQLPCDVAFSRGHKHVLSELCACKNGLHKKNLIFYPRNILFKSLQQKDDAFQNYVHKKGQYFEESNMRCIMNIPLLGLVDFDDEANAVKTAIVSIVEDICRRIGEKDELLTNTVILSGSVAENTKVGLPDEFDFLCVLDKISEFVDVKYDDSKNLKVTLKEKSKGDACMRFFEGLFLSHNRLIDRFDDVLQEIIQRADIYTHPNIFHVTLGVQKPFASPNFQLKIRWSCCKYKTLTVKIDLVPVCRIKCDRDSKLHSQIVNPNTVQKETLLILFQYETSSRHPGLFNIVTVMVQPQFRESASDAEKLLLATFPPQAKDAYVMSKILICDRVCPFVMDVIKENKLSEDKCASIITSYMLKNCLFHVVEEIPLGTASVLSMHEYVCRIFQKLLQCAIEGNLPCYMFPRQNLFTMKDKHKSRFTCVNRAMYAKLILNILGKDEDFADINPDIDDNCCNVSDSNGQMIVNMSDFLYESDFPCDNNICANCKKNPVQHDISLEECFRCKLWTYCSVKCREENWRRHRMACDYHSSKTIEP